MGQKDLEAFVDEARQVEPSEKYSPGNERWEQRPLSEFIEPVLGKTPKRSKEKYWKGGDIKWASAKDISQSEIRHVYDTEDQMTEEGKEASNAKILPEGTVVVIARGATMGRVAQLGEPMAFNQTCYALDTNEELLDDYLYYAWQYVFGQVQAVSYGTVFDTITMKSFNDIDIPAPPIDVQRRISDILSVFDNKIENNNRIQKYLKSTAETIFKGSFNQYIGYDNLKDSEIGKVPKSFSIIEIGDLLSLEYGEGLPEREREGDEYPVYGSNGITGRHNECLVNGPGIIVGRKGANFGTVKLEYNSFWPIDTTFYVDPKNEDELLYIYHILKSIPFQHLGSDSAVPGLNRNVAYDQKLALPPEEDREKFIRKVKPIHGMIDDLGKENEMIDGLRDTLLPELISGSITIGK